MILVNRLFVVLIGILDEFSDRIALIKRNNPPYRGFWSLVGGKIKSEEEIISAAKREALEETRANLTELRFHGILEEFLYYENNTKLDAFHIFVVSGQTKKEKFKCSEEGEVRWFQLRNIGSIPIIPSDKLMITKMIFHSTNNILKFARATLQETRNSVKLVEFKIVSEYNTQVH